MKNLKQNLQRNESDSIFKSDASAKCIYNLKDHTELNFIVGKTIYNATTLHIGLIKGGS